MKKPKNSGAPEVVSNSRTVAKNTAWGSVEAIFGIVANIFTSILIARVLGFDKLGKDRLGDYQYIVWLTTISFTMGSFGLPATTRKYMAEYLNNGKPEIARATYLTTLRTQSLLSVAAAAVGFLAIAWLGSPHFLVPSILLVLAIVPRLIATIPSQANNAGEAVRRNATPAVIGVAITAIVTIVGLLLGWGFVGLSAAVLLGALAECALKLRSVEQWLGAIPRGAVPEELRRRMLSYSGQGLALLILNLVVWDRSDVLLLGKLNHDSSQVTYFNFPFSLVDRMLLLPTLFAGSLAATMMAQYGRGKGRLKEMTVDGGRYALLVAIPLLVGMACVSRPLVLLVYSPSFWPMISTMTIMALFAVPKALVNAPTLLLQTTERQTFLIYWGCVCGVVDLSLDVLLIGRHGANGAAIANGTAQALAALGIWIYVWRKDDLNLRLGEWGRILLSGALMALGALLVVRNLPGIAGLVLAIAAGGVLWFLGLRLTRALNREDVDRFRSIGTQLPASARPYWMSLIGWLAPSPRAVHSASLEPPAAV